MACVPEGELFAGGGLLGPVRLRWPGDAERGDLRLQAEGVEGRGFRLPWPREPWRRRQAEGIRKTVLRSALAIANLYGAIALFTFIRGPWRVEVPFRASASSADKPASVTLFLLFVALLLSRRFHNVIRRGSTETFYLLCAVACWLLTWGPFPRLFGQPALYQAPYAWLLPLPGAGSLRVPARLWMMTVLCLVVFMGLGAARLLAARTKRAAAILTAVAACALAADGFTTINAADIPLAPLVPPSGKTVLFLPVGELQTDITASYLAATQQYRSINGYSGYEPPYYEALRTLSTAQDPRLFLPFVGHDELHVLVPRDAAELRTMIAAQPGSQLVLEGPVARYRVPARPVPPVRTDPSGRRIPVQAVEATCAVEARGLAIDGNLRTRWVCGVQFPDQTLTADLGAPAQVGAIVHAQGSVGGEFPRHLVIETSVDGSTWIPAWDGSPAAAVLFAAMAKPLDTRAVIEFPSRTARYVRLRQLARGGGYAWSLAELEVWSGGS